MTAQLGPQQVIAVAAICEWSHCFASPRDRLYRSLGARGLIRLEDDVWRPTALGRGVSCALRRAMGQRLTMAGHRACLRYRRRAQAMLPDNAAEIVTQWMRQRGERKP